MTGEPFERFAAGRGEKGGLWARVRVTDLRADGAIGLVFVGIGADRDTPLRPWPTFHIERRKKDEQVLVWVACLGFFLAFQTKSVPRKLERLDRFLVSLDRSPREFVFSQLLLLVDDEESAAHIAERVPVDLRRELRAWLERFPPGRPPLDPKGMFGTPEEAHRRMLVLLRQIEATERASE